MYAIIEITIQFILERLNFNNRFITNVRSNVLIVWRLLEKKKRSTKILKIFGNQFATPMTPDKNSLKSTEHLTRMF